MRNFSSLTRQYDTLCKRVLAIKSVLAWILKSTLKECRPFTLKQIEAMIGPTGIKKRRVLASDSVSKIPGEGVVLYDITFDLFLPDGTIAMLVDIEAQDSQSLSKQLPRGVYYLARLVSDEKGTVFEGDRYQDLKKACSIWIRTDGIEKRDAYVNVIDFHDRDIVGTSGIQEAWYDKLALVTICLGRTDGLPLGIERDMLEMLGNLFSKTLPFTEKEGTLKNRYHIVLDDDERKEVAGMCNLGEALARENWQQGRIEGRIEGRAEGKEEGFTQGALHTWTVATSSLMQAQSCSVDDAFLTLHVPLAYQEIVRKALS